MNAASWVTSAFDDFGDSAFIPSSSQPFKATQSRKRSREPEPSSAAGKVKPCASIDQGSAAAEGELWVEKYAPKCAAELAVHKKKIQEVQGWLEHGLNRKSKHAPMLLLTGPCGTAKTATVRALAADLRCEVHEWVNPVADTYDGSLAAWRDRQDFAAVGMSGYESQSSQFQDFLLRANRYPTLQIFQQHQLRSKLILVEDFPNVFFRDVSQFHSILRSYHGRGQCPIVFIVSDSAGGESNERLLFPKDFQAELNIAAISFNPVAQTSLLKVLSKIAASETSKSKKCGKFEVPDKHDMERLATSSAGDIRAAVNALQFTCLRGSQPQTVLQKSKPGKSKGGSLRVKVKGQSRKKTCKEGDSKGELASIGGRDTSLFLFRALGKILYCKRGDPSEESDAISLPPHLKQHYRDPLLIQPEEVIEKSHLSGDFFTSYLHENYLEFYTSIDDVVDASAYFSDADYLTIDWASRSTLKDYAASVASRGLMFSNSARAASSGGGPSGLGFKPLHKPQWFSVCKQARENISAAKQLFKGYCPPVELQTQVVPYMATVRAQGTAGQQMFISQIGKMQKYTRKTTGQRLDEKDISELQDESESQDSTQTLNTPVSGVTVMDDLEEDDQGQMGAEEEEVVIDDFDD